MCRVEQLQPSANDYCQPLGASKLQRDALTDDMRGVSPVVGGTERSHVSCLG